MVFNPGVFFQGGVYTGSETVEATVGMVGTRVKFLI